MLSDGIHEHPEHIDCLDIIQSGGRVKAGIIEKRELQNEYDRGIFRRSEMQTNNARSDTEIRVSLRSSKFPSVELFTLRDLEPADYLLVLVAIPRNRDNT